MNALYHVGTDVGGGHGDRNGDVGDMRDNHLLPGIDVVEWHSM